MCSELYELVLASILGLVALADISVPYSQKIYAIDASMMERSCDLQGN